MARLSFRCDQSLVDEVDSLRGLIPREAWLRVAVEQQVHRMETWDTTRRNQLGQPPRSSQQAKADVQSRPKGGK